MPNKLTESELIEMFRATATDEQARKEFAQSRAEVILPMLDEQSSVRAIFRPEKLGPGATPVWDIPFEDIDCVWMMSGLNQTPSVQVEGKQLSINTFGVDGGVDWSIDVASDGRIQVAQLATTMLKNKFLAIEELCGWNMVKAHAAVLPTEQKLQAYGDDGKAADPGAGKFNVFTIAELLTLGDEIGIGGRKVTDIYLSPRRYNDMRLAVGAGTALPDELKMQLWGGGQGNPNAVPGLRVHKIYNRDLVANNKGYAFTQKDGYTYGVMPIRENLHTYDDPMAQNEYKAGVKGRARYGFGILDDKGLIEITF